MERFEEAFAGLNDAQRQAVTTIDGSVLVIAGPGTGKTQLLGTRIGHIIKTTDTDPSNILALTFTEVGVTSLRSRLDKLIPKVGYRVGVSTYHGFSNELIRHNLEYFEGMEAEPLDELGRTTVLHAVIEALPYSNPFKFAEFYQNDLLSFISDAKRALLVPSDIKKIAAANIEFVSKLSKKAQTELNKLSQAKRIGKDSAETFERLLDAARTLPAGKLPADVECLNIQFTASLEQALAVSQAGDKFSTKPLTKWKNQWLAKDSGGQFIIEGRRLNQRLEAAATIYEQYEKKLSISRQYDYDDMILRAIDVLEKNPEFKYSLAEKYQYLMLDEFQDTNAAQMRLIELLTDHPVHERRPNVMAVGDDDQAIYAFQGADYGNMAHFLRLYRDVKVISLSQNYRAHEKLIELSESIAGQINGRLHQSLEGVEKSIVAGNKKFAQPLKLEVREFISDAAQYKWIAGQINKLVKKSGIEPSEIAVIAPKHRYLKPLLPYLAGQKLPVSYEKRENVLDSPPVRQLEQMAKLVTALNEPSQAMADSLWPEILSYDFWQVSTETVWQLSWEARKTRASWTELLLKDRALSKIAKFFLKLNNLLKLTTLEEQLDALMGLPGASEKLNLPARSPFYEYFFGTDNQSKNPLLFTELMSNLSLLRFRLRAYQKSENKPVNLADFVAFVESYRMADINLLNTSPYHESAEAVNLTTAYGAKGREFQAVFIVASQDEVWGPTSRNRSPKVKLPANLQHISYRGMSEDERLKLFYVAITRAKTHLYMTSYQKTLAGKPARPLSFLTGVAPELIKDDTASISPETARDYWAAKYLPPFRPRLKNLLNAQLDNYKISATHLNAFVDLINGGPQEFFVHNLLGFPKAPTPTTAFGTAMHNTLSWTGNQLARRGKLPTQIAVLEKFSRELTPAWLSAEEYELQKSRGQTALKVWLSAQAKNLAASDRYEQSFAAESSNFDGVRLTGKIDWLKVDHKRRAVTVVDFKTGKSYEKWSVSEVKLHKFRQQLMFYKLLVENSSTYRGYSVESGTIEFVEPNENGKITILPMSYDDKELQEFKLLLKAIWQKTQNLDFPDTSKYPPSVAGIKAFEKDLRAGAT